MPYEGEKRMIMQIWIRFLASAQQVQDITYNRKEYPQNCHTTMGQCIG